MELQKAEQLSNRIRYAGQQYDNLTKQYYLRARYYDQLFGRFLQEDTYQGDGLNLYICCNNNPIIYYDPSGYITQQEILDKLSSMTYEQKVELLYQRRDEYFQHRIDTGSMNYSNQGLMPGELDSVYGYDAGSRRGFHLIMSRVPVLYIMNWESVVKMDRV